MEEDLLSWWRRWWDGRISIKSDNVNKLNITLDAYGGEYLVMEEDLTQLVAEVVGWKNLNQIRQCQ